MVISANWMTLGFANAKRNVRAPAQGPLGAPCPGSAQLGGAISRREPLRRELWEWGAGGPHLRGWSRSQLPSSPRRFRGGVQAPSHGRLELVVTCILPGLCFRFPGGAAWEAPRHARLLAGKRPSIPAFETFLPCPARFLPPPLPPFPAMPSPDSPRLSVGLLSPPHPPKLCSREGGQSSPRLLEQLNP